MKTIARIIATLATIAITLGLAAPAQADDTTPSPCVTAEAWAAAHDKALTMGAVHRAWGTPGTLLWTFVVRMAGYPHDKIQERAYPACDGGTYEVRWDKYAGDSVPRWHPLAWPSDPLPPLPAA